MLAKRDEVRSMIDRRKYFYTKGFKCIDCGKPITNRATKCRKCAAQNRNPLREKSSNWKGGEHFYRGYIWIYKPEHPYHQYNGDVKRARLVVEANIGGYLTPSEYIHHINGIKVDDRFNNLMILSKGEHSALHNRITGCRNPYRDGRGKFGKKISVLL